MLKTPSIDGEVIEYENGQLWFLKEGEIVSIGISNNGIEELGGVKAFEFPEQGSDLKDGENFTEVIGYQSSIDLIAPIAGTIAEVNSILENDPSLLSDDPYGEDSWIIKIKAKHPEKI